MRYGSDYTTADSQATAAMKVDFSWTALSRQSSYTNIHVMAGETDRGWQTAQEAIESGIASIVRSAASGKLDIADHGALDLPTHRGASMKEYKERGWLEHYNKYDKDVPQYIQEWTIDKMLANRQIRDYYQQFDQNSGYVPGPAIYESRYDLRTLGTETWAGGVGSFSLVPGVTISGSDSSISTISNTNWSPPPPAVSYAPTYVDQYYDWP